MPNGDPGDPYEGFNRAMFSFNEGFDESIGKPVAIVYKAILPFEVRVRVRNFFANIQDVMIGANNLLQGKPGDTVNDWARVVFNTTLGLAGMHDIASEMGLEKHNEDFGQTFAVWGIPQGNFLTLPVLGPQTVRSAVGWPLDFLSKPLRWIDTGGQFAALVGLNIVDSRARLAPAIRLRDETAFDPYIFTREAFLQQRLNLIHDGNPPIQELEDLDLLEEEQLLEEEKSEGNIQ